MEKETDRKWSIVYLRYWPVSAQGESVFWHQALAFGYRRCGFCTLASLLWAQSAGFSHCLSAGGRHLLPVQADALAQQVAAAGLVQNRKRSEYVFQILGLPS